MPLLSNGRSIKTDLDCLLREKFLSFRTLSSTGLFLTEACDGALVLNLCRATLGCEVLGCSTRERLSLVVLVVVVITLDFFWKSFDGL